MFGGGRFWNTQVNIPDFWASVCRRHLTSEYCIMTPSWPIVPIYSLLALGMIRTISAMTHFLLEAARKPIEKGLGFGACMLFAKRVPVRMAPTCISFRNRPLQILGVI